MNQLAVKYDVDKKRYLTTTVTQNTKNNPEGHRQPDEDYSDNMIIRC